MLFWAVREDKLFGWGRVPNTDLVYRDMAPNWATDARNRTVERLTEFLSGAVRAHPVDTEQCRWCDFAAACRVEQYAEQQTLVVIGV
jgi:predicted RecB family nuclease